MDSPDVGLLFDRSLVIVTSATMSIHRATLAKRLDAECAKLFRYTMNHLDTKLKFLRKMSSLLLRFSKIVPRTAWKLWNLNIHFWYYHVACTCTVYHHM